MTTQTTTTAIATRDDGPAAMVQRYQDDFAQVMPSHVKADTWVRLAVGPLRRDPKLAQAAANDVGQFLAELKTAARLGLEPGTEQFYLTIRKYKGVPKVQGIVGYQGIVELIYRAGAASSVVVEVKRENDRFTYRPGRDERPIHEVDWFGEDRGALEGVYAYAVMKDGATSKVVVLNRKQVMAAKARSDGKNSEYSPWNTDEEAMWLKTAVRRLAKWVPTSAEYMTELLRAANAAAAPAPTVEVVAPAGRSLLDQVDPDTGEVVDGELVDDHDHDGDYDASCMACRAEQVAVDRQNASAS